MMTSTMRSNISGVSNNGGIGNIEKKEKVDLKVKKVIHTFLFYTKIICSLELIYK